MSFTTIVRHNDSDAQGDKRHDYHRCAYTDHLPPDAGGHPLDKCSLVGSSASGAMNPSSRQAKAHACGARFTAPGPVNRRGC